MALGKYVSLFAIRPWEWGLEDLHLFRTSILIRSYYEIKTNNIPFFNLGSVYSPMASSAEQTTEINNSN